mgnify:CR=1 FL=1
MDLMGRFWCIKRSVVSSLISQSPHRTMISDGSIFLEIRIWPSLNVIAVWGGIKQNTRAGTAILTKGHLVQKDFLESSILPENKREQCDLKYHRIVFRLISFSFFRSLFGRIQDTKKSFRNQLTLEPSQCIMPHLNDQFLICGKSI